MIFLDSIYSTNFTYTMDLITHACHIALALKVGKENIKE